VAEGYAGFLLKPVRQSMLVERLRDFRAGTIAKPEEEPLGPGETEALPGNWNALAMPEELPPLVAAPASDSPQPQAQIPQAPAPLPRTESQTGLTILLAEDNPINMMLIRELLKRRGHGVVEVTNGEDAVKAMAQQSFDLLLTDIHMPGMDGIDAARAIRQGEAAAGRPRVPIVALTADAMETGKRACQDAGMDGFLTKPVDPAELEEMFLMLFPSEDGPLIVAA
jgi:CheY-like chemotaxis protein